MRVAGKLVVLGSTNVDYIPNFDVSPMPGGIVISNHYQVAFGGRGASQAVAAGRNGVDIAFIACTGDDDIGERIRRQPASGRIDVAPVCAAAGETTGVALVFVSAEGESIIGIHAGASAVLSASQVKVEKERITSAQALLMQLKSPLKSALVVVEIVHRHQITVVLNPAPARELSGELLALVDIVTPNETEAEKLTGTRVESDEDVTKAADVLHVRGIGTAMITFDSRGIWLNVEGESRRIPGFRAQAADIVAAGNTFNGALVTALLEGTSLPETTRLAHAAAAIVATRKGAQPSVPWRTEIDEFLAQQG